MESAEERKFREYLEVEGLKFTPERRIVLKKVFSIHNHFEAEDIVLSLRVDGERISRASVYRTLNLLLMSGLLSPVHSAEKHGHFEHTFGHEHHDHFICSECKEVLEFADENLEAALLLACRKHGFNVASHKLEVYGLCAECMKNKNT
jgi:Fur family ferric uptake transcriptional regulator